MSSILIQFKKLLEKEEKKKGKDDKGNSAEDDILHMGFDGEIKSSVEECVPTSLADLDRILCRDKKGVYGLPCGRQIEIHGAESSGKSTLAYLLMRRWQEHFGELGLVLIIENESSL